MNSVFIAIANIEIYWALIFIYHSDTGNKFIYTQITVNVLIPTSFHKSQKLSNKLSTKENKFPS